MLFDTGLLPSSILFAGEAGKVGDDGDERGVDFEDLGERDLCEPCDLGLDDIMEYWS